MSQNPILSAVLFHLDTLESSGFNRMRALHQLLEFGADCMPGFTGERQAAAFFEQHRPEILRLLTLAVNVTGRSIADLVPSWNSADPFALERYNQSRLTWAALERMARAYQIRLLAGIPSDADAELGDFVEVQHG